MRADSLDRLNREIIACHRCPRLVKYRAQVAAEKRRAYSAETYWGRPLPGFGDPKARLLIVGLAPAAHGGNRTGRVFTGDASGDWLFAAMHRAGFANQPTSVHREDGLALVDAYITATIHCAPPENKPLPEEIQNCQAFLDRDFGLLSRKRVIIALGKIAFDNTLAALARKGVEIPRPRPSFGHALSYDFDSSPLTLIASYHPSRRNTQTGLLTEPMFDQVFAHARKMIQRDAR